MNLHFLGGYLLAEGSVTPEQLAQAIAHQARANRRLGELARNMGVLTPEQVAELLRLQGDTDLSFGELAMAKGYLSRKCLNDLLFHQAVCQVHLGEALLTTGALTPEQFQASLERFAQVDATQRNTVSFLLAESAEQQALTILLRALERAFLRFVGLPLKACGLLSAAEIDALPHAFGLAIVLPGRRDIEVLLRMDDRMLGLMTSSLAHETHALLEAGPANSAEDALEAAGVFFQVVARYCRQNLEALATGALCRTLEGGYALPGDAQARLRLSLVCPDAAMGLVSTRGHGPPTIPERTP